MNSKTFLRLVFIKINQYLILAFFQDQKRDHMFNVSSILNGEIIKVCGSGSIARGMEGDS